MEKARLNGLAYLMITSSKLGIDGTDDKIGKYISYFDYTICIRLKNSFMALR